MPREVLIAYNFDLSSDIWPHQDHRSEKHASLQKLPTNTQVRSDFSSLKFYLFTVCHPKPDLKKEIFTYLLIKLLLATPHGFWDPSSLTMD